MPIATCSIRLFIHVLGLYTTWFNIGLTRNLNSVKNMTLFFDFLQFKKKETFLISFWKLKGRHDRQAILFVEELKYNQKKKPSIYRCVGVARRGRRVLGCASEKKGRCRRFEYKIRRKTHLQFKWAREERESCPIFPTFFTTSPTAITCIKRRRKKRQGDYITVDRRRRQHDELTLPFSLNLNSSFFIFILVFI